MRRAARSGAPGCASCAVIGSTTAPAIADGLEPSTEKRSGAGQAMRGVARFCEPVQSSCGG